MTTVHPFKIDVLQSTLSAIRDRVAAFEWHEAPRGAGLEDSWDYGTNLDYMRDLCAYWVKDYDWRKWEKALNCFPQYQCRVEDIDIHFYRVDGSGPNPRPMILTHGWPGSVLEFLHIIEPLAHPERFGGDVKDAFTVVVPSLPGYGFSGKPRRPISPRTIARLFDTLMVDALGLPNYIAQGGDWGALVSGWLGYDGKGCRGVHMNMIGWVSPGVEPETDEERRFAEVSRRLFESERGYLYEQTTKPQTLSYAMMDSPVGACAWIIEKFHGWSDIRQGFETVYSRDLLLTNVMIYLVTRSFNTATWLYRGMVEDLSGEPVPEKARIEKPVAVANFLPVVAAGFPADMSPFPPRSEAERSLNLVRWTNFKKGGHFAALERPDDLIEDIRAFARAL